MESVNVYCVFVLLIAVDIVSGQIAFPENNVDPTIKNRDNRQPIYAPTKCPENELFYPGDQKNDWICDCRPAYVFHPRSDMCHAVYRRGPCAESEYLLLSAGSVIPKCAANPCLQDGLVPWQNRCLRLDSTEQCPVIAGRASRLGVNAATLALECQVLEFSTRLGEDEESTGCPPGCRRSINGACTPPQQISV